LLFKGEKNNGFDVLYHNMKHGVIASKELAEFLREKSAIEENNYKLLSKVAKQASSSTQGTFAPVWAALRGAAEKLAVLHLQMAQRVTELIKDVSKYADELHKRHKAVRNHAFLFAPLCYPSLFPAPDLVSPLATRGHRGRAKRETHHPFTLFTLTRHVPI